SHKGTFGNLLLIAGSNRYTGAAALMVEAALRTGVGLVVVICTHLTAQVIRVRCPEAIIVEVEEEGGVFHKTAIDKISHTINDYHFSAIGMGPGVGSLKNESDFYHQLMSLFSKLTCHILFDEYALAQAFQWVQSNSFTENQLVFTPHPKEFLRMIGLSAIEDVNKEVLNASKQVSQIIVYKTHSTIVGSYEGIWRSSTGNQSLATAGSGDVLAGIISSFMAQGVSVTDAAKIGVYLHGLVAEIASNKLGLRAVLARDLCDFISAGLMALGESNA
ncbi:MAG: NAD(P)H-hydrate dehydratase, partial [Candidatus Margulisiibacteriota bacterium]